MESVRQIFEEWDSEREGLVGRQSMIEILNVIAGLCCEKAVALLNQVSPDTDTCRYDDVLEFIFKSSLSPVAVTQRRRRRRRHAGSKLSNAPCDGGVMNDLCDASSQITTTSRINGNVTWDDLGSDLLMGQPDEAAVALASVRPILKEASTLFGENRRAVEGYRSTSEVLVSQPRLEQKNVVLPPPGLTAEEQSPPSTSLVSLVSRFGEPCASDSAMSAKTWLSEAAALKGVMLSLSEMCSSEEPATHVGGDVWIDEAPLEGKSKRPRRRRRRKTPAGEDPSHTLCSSTVLSADRTVVTWSDLDRSCASPEAQATSNQKGQTAARAR